MPEGYAIDALAMAAVKQSGGHEVLDEIASRTATGENVLETLGDELADAVR